MPNLSVSAKAGATAPFGGSETRVLHQLFSFGTGAEIERGYYQPAGGQRPHLRNGLQESDGSGIPWVQALSCLITSSISLSTFVSCRLKVSIKACIFSRTASTITVEAISATLKGTRLVFDRFT